jgi:hypothetical protein
VMRFDGSIDVCSVNKYIVLCVCVCVLIADHFESLCVVVNVEFFKKNTTKPMEGWRENGWCDGIL